MRSSVDFPQPDGPTMQRNSPAAILRSILSSASTRPAALTYSLRRPAISIAAPRRSTVMMRTYNYATENLDRAGCTEVAARSRHHPRKGSPASRELAVFVLQHEWRQLRYRLFAVAGVDDAFEREVGGAH